ncbi:MAG: type VI secretion system tip protein TssI/VgrG [Pseudomonadota bacterium]
MLEHITALFGHFSQANRLLRLTTPLGGNTLLAECVRGEETISEGYTFTISALSHDAGISLRSLLGQPALLELLTASGAGARPFHGYLTAVELNGANGGMARYTLTLQPWSAFLARGRDSRVFQDMTVFDILDAVFGAYQGRGKLAPDWRFETVERSVYPVRSLTTQYQESDLAFVERLMSEEGLFYFFEHKGVARSPSLGSHQMVIADHNGAFVPNVQAHVRFTQPGAVMKEDSIDRWRSELKLQTNAIELRSWDYRTLDCRPVSSASLYVAEGAEMISRDVPGAYAYADRSQGQRIADHQMEAIEARREVFIGAGTVRTLGPGTTFTLSGQAAFDLVDGADARRFAIIRTVHLMHNNLSAELKGDVHRRIGESELTAVMGDEQASSLHAVGSAQGERPLYRNRIDAIRAKVPFRASRTDGQGRLLHPRPSIHGQQSAIVVGPPGAVIHTDRDHRVKVQFHWQRDGGDGMSHSRLSHPTPEGHSGAPGDDRAGTWVRVAAPLAPIAGANWGSHAMPRVGQEVLVDFLEGNIDRPVIIGALYNGAGQSDAQNNRVSRGAGVATGNAPVWFPGRAGPNAHQAVLSGLKSQTMQTSQGGTGAYSQLVFDDSPAQPRLSLQRHARAHEGTAELNMGHLRHQTDNQRLTPSGFGAELKTEHSLAMRAGQGMLLSTDKRLGAVGSQLDSREAHTQITASQKLLVDMATTAQKHNARIKKVTGEDEAKPEMLPAIAQLSHSAEVIQTTNGGDVNSEASDGGLAKVAAYSEPFIQVSSPAGIVATTPGSGFFAAGICTSICAGQDINAAAQGSSFYAVQSGISFFTYGKASAKEKPNQETGIKLHAASGKFSCQSQSDATSITADGLITVASVSKSVAIAAKNHVLMTAQGAYLKLEGGNIMLHSPGKVSFKATMKELTGPDSSSAVLPEFSTSNMPPNRLAFERRYHDDEPLAGAPYSVTFVDGTTRKGFLDGAGRAVLDDVPPGAAQVRFGAMPGQYARKGAQPTPGYVAAPKKNDIEALLDKYSKNSGDV